MKMPINKSRFLAVLMPKSKSLVCVPVYCDSYMSKVLLCLPPPPILFSTSDVCLSVTQLCPLYKLKTVQNTVTKFHTNICRPRWLSWMRHPTGDQEVAGSTSAEVGNILSWRLIMKYFLRSFSPIR